MEHFQHCPQTGKIYIIILFSLVFTSILTSINVISYEKVDNNIFGCGIAVNVIQIIFTLYLIGMDIAGKIGPKLSKTVDYVYTVVILLSAAYMISFGILTLMSVNDPNDEQDITTLAIASSIAGSVGILFMFSDVVCLIGCYC